MKRKIISLVCVFFIMCISAVLVFDILQYNTGVVTKITAKAQGDELHLKLAYFLPMGGYSVREVNEDEGEYWGESVKDYDGSLGKYRIMVIFGDVEPHKSIKKSASADGIIAIKNPTIGLKAKIAYLSGHGFALYIGSDKPMYIENTEGNQLNGLLGTIIIPIRIGDTE